jgi:phage protein U
MTAAPASTLIGVVVDDAQGGAPVVGATITASHGRTPQVVGSSTTDAEGRYAIAGLEARKTYLIQIELDGGRQDVSRVQMKAN